MWPKEKNVAAFYGNPDLNQDGTADSRWEIENIVALKPAYAMVLAWNPAQVVSRIRVHKLCAESLNGILRQIGELGTEFIHHHELDHYGGGYNFRLKRGGAMLSMHSYGCAIDLSPARNPFKKKWDPASMMPEKVVEIFEKEGWEFGGRWSTPDAMHFQAAT